VISLDRIERGRLDRRIASNIMGYCTHEKVKRGSIDRKLHCLDCGFETNNPEKLDTFKPSKNPGHATHALWKWQKITQKSIYQIEYDGDIFSTILSWNDFASVVHVGHISLPISASLAIDQYLMATKQAKEQG